MDAMSELASGWITQLLCSGLSVLTQLFN